MIVSSTAGFVAPDRSASRPAAADRSAGAAASVGLTAGSAARVSWSGGGAAAPVYSDPRARPGAVRLWSAPVSPDDRVSALMARNQALGSYTLSDQWRGLGGALLTRLAATGENYAQTLVDEVVNAAGDEIPGLTPEAQAQRAAAVLARQERELGGVAMNAPAVGLTIQTRAGESVQLDIAVSSGLNGIVGMKVEIHASGAMSEPARAAVAQLADGLDRLLEGLGGAETAVLDLSGLMNYDRDVLASIDVSASNPMSHQPLGSFSLHLGDDRHSVKLKGGDGEMSLSVDAGTSPGPQRGAAIQRTLDRLDGAGERSRANAALVRQMKAAFKDFQSAAGRGAADGGSGASGLADFDASLGGETWRSNRFGTTHEAGQASYQLSQKTTTSNGGRTVAQTVSEQLSADYRRAPGEAMLDVRNGNFSATRIRDASTVTTSTDSPAGRPASVLRKTEARQLKTVTDFRDHRVTHQQSWPSKTSLLERLA